jgi:beta-xylosidase
MQGARALGALSVALVAVLAGCAGQPAAEPSASDGPAAFLIDQDFADPDVIAGDDGYVAFGINGAGSNVQMATSPDLAEWDVLLDDALPQLPAWATEGRTWAPDVVTQPGGGYVLYFTAAHAASDRQCIGAAVSDAVTGPYVPIEGEPLVCTLDQGGSIDPASFTDADGTRYLLWKNDGNCCAMDTWIQLTPLTPDGLAVAGPATKLFEQTEAWEGQLVEGPIMVERDGTYVVFYSANDYGSEDYAIGVASAPDIAGPYVKQPEPFLSSAATGGRYLGPGGQEIVSTADGDVMVFHGWDELFLYRGMHSLPLEWDGDVPVLSLEG